MMQFPLVLYLYLEKKTNVVLSDKKVRKSLCLKGKEVFYLFPTQGMIIQ